MAAAGVSASLWWLAPLAVAVTINWSPVGNAGNVADTAVMLDGTAGYGSVGYSYRIGTFDVTNRQYTEFLNAKDPAGMNLLALYTSGMTSSVRGGINFNAANPLGSKYTTKPGREDQPVSLVSWYDAARFANWLNNGQGNASTETGAYTLLGGTPTPFNGVTVARNPGATVFLPSHDEWYKAAYYDPAAGSYYQYPTFSNSLPTASLPTGAANAANFNNVKLDLTNVGAYSGTQSPYGAYDMGGNVFQWTDSLFDPQFQPSPRVFRGGAWNSPAGDLLSSGKFGSDPRFEFSYVGFRVAMVPEPPTASLAALAIAIASGCARRRRKSSGSIPLVGGNVQNRRPSVDYPGAVA